MAAGDLCTLPEARQWCGVDGNTTSADDVIRRLISAVSRTLLGYCNRPFVLPRTVMERYDGNGRARLMLRHWPVSSITSLSIDGAAVPAADAANPVNGFLLEPWDGIPPGRPQSLDLFGRGFSTGRQNIPVSYVAGYLVAAEAQTIPADGMVSVAAPYGPWGSDFGVTVNGVAATAIAASGTPSTNQYALAADTSGKYQFATADNGKAALISYGFVPFDLFHACVEQVAERHAYKGRIGTTSKSLGGAETVSYSLKDIPDAVKLMLQPFRNVVPL